MQHRNKLLVGFTAVVLSGTFAFGAVASASGNGDGEGRSQLTTAEKCAKVDDVEAHVAHLQQRISERTATLQERRATAEANGHADRVANIDRRLERLAKISARLTTRLSKVETWAAANCAG